MIGESAWPAFWGTVAGGVLAIAGGFLAAWSQLRAQREERREVRAERRRDRREEDLRQLQDQTIAIIDQHSRGRGYRSAGQEVPSSLRHEQTLTASMISVISARIGDPPLYQRVAQLIDAAMKWQEEDPNAPNFAAAFNAVQTRVGELIRLTLEQEEIAELEEELARLEDEHGEN